jgi:hypothetical protein
MDTLARAPIVVTDRVVGDAVVALDEANDDRLLADEAGAAGTTVVTFLPATLPVMLAMGKVWAKQ